MVYLQFSVSDLIRGPEVESEQGVVLVVKLAEVRGCFLVRYPQSNVLLIQGAREGGAGHGWGTVNSPRIC